MLEYSPLRRDKGSLSSSNLGRIMLEKNGTTMDFFPGDVSTDRIMALQVLFLFPFFHLSMATCIIVCMLACIPLN